MKDPVSFNHFLLTHQELELLKLFDGQRSEQEILFQFQTRLSTDRLTIEQVNKFGSRLLGDQLATVDELGFGEHLWATERIRKKRNLQNQILSPLVIRLRGLNPTPILNTIKWFEQFFFHPATVLANLTVCLFIFLFAFGNFDALSHKFPVIQQFLSAQNLVALIIVMSVVKIAHELGHALACRSCGGECNEIGVIFLAFIPTLYCNVTDAWTFPDRWKRLLVSFGGIYIEITIASAAAILWILTPQGNFNAMMFNVMLLCSLNTILINGNPLLRYDGYYLLSDFTEQPNLRITANQSLGNFVRSFFYVATPHSKSVPKWILPYAILSTIYRCFVMASIGLMIYWFFKGLELRIIGQLLVIFLLSSPFIILLKQVLMNRRLRSPKRIRKLSFLKSGLSIFSISILTAAFFYLPLPNSLSCNFTVQAKSSNPIFSPSAGKLIYISRAYEAVEQGQPIAIIENLQLNQQIREHESKLARAEIFLAELRVRVSENQAIASKILILEKDIISLQQELELLIIKQAKLTITAPSSGIIVPAERISKAISKNFMPTSALGSMSDPRNYGAQVARGDKLLTLEPANDSQLVLYVGERNIDLVTAGQDVRLVFTQQSGTVVDGKVTNIYEVDVDTNSQEIVSTGLETYLDSAGIIRSTQTPYRVIATAEHIPPHAYTGSSGRARIYTKPKTLASKLKYSIQHLVSFNL